MEFSFLKKKNSVCLEESADNYKNIDHNTVSMPS